MKSILAFDPGYGNIKLYGSSGGEVLQSAVAFDDNTSLRRVAGLRVGRPPLSVVTEAGRFRVGEGAHDWGRPIENLDLGRLMGSPEMMALWYGAMSSLVLPAEAIELIVGVPIHSFSNEESGGMQQTIKKAMQGEHRWLADGDSKQVTIASVMVTSQPVGAMFDYLLDEHGRMSAQRAVVFQSELGVLDIGMNTIDLLVVRNGTLIQRFTTGDTLGVRRLLDLAGSDAAFSLAERDSLLRSGRLLSDESMALWRSEVLGYIEKKWGEMWRRLAVVVCSGGGSLLLKDTLVKKFRSKVYLPDDPILAIARGLYKYAIMRSEKAQRRRNG